MKIFALILIGWPIASVLFALAWIGFYRLPWNTTPSVPDQAYADDFARQLSGSASSRRRPSLPGAEPDTTIVYTVPNGPSSLTSCTTPDDAVARRSRGDEIRHLHSVH